MSRERFGGVTAKRNPLLESSGHLERMICHGQGERATGHPGFYIPDSFGGPLARPTTHQSGVSQCWGVNLSRVSYASRIHRYYQLHTPYTAFRSVLNRRQLALSLGLALPVTVPSRIF